MNCCDTETNLSAEIIQKLKWVLYIVFFINAGMFLVELVGGIVSHSNALIADSLDMFGDAFIYGLSIFVLSKNHKIQARASLLKGVSMLLLGLYVLGAGFLVGYFNSMWPDTIVGLGIAGLALYFSIEIIRESKKHV